MNGAQRYSDGPDFRRTRFTSLSSVQSPTPTSLTPPITPDETPQKRTKFATVYAEGKAKRYSTRRSSAWKAVSRRISTFQGSGYMDFNK